MEFDSKQLHESSSKKAHPQQFEQISLQILAASGGCYFAVDVAFCAGLNDYAVVEVNPPFALDDCGISIAVYCQYCIDAAEYIQQQMQACSQ